MLLVSFSVTQVTKNCKIDCVLNEIKLMLFSGMACALHFICQIVQNFVFDNFVICKYQVFRHGQFTVIFFLV